MNIVKSDNNESVNLNAIDYPRRQVEENFSWEKIAGKYLEESKIIEIGNQ